ncbi:palmitoyltransferase ZDHHC23-A-like isoform X1 [Xyrauchen texanus]|uniref:palmitoyltransferase ZDHHC23-A-like isoform X1 n=1 Tax=Xyrauchen texanus TaxID=154827 RepID=UPI002241E99D|nr:palmitoyltransferase ZDHHC23-A-like isoform X1 [Xyrauchen texanus]
MKTERFKPPEPNDPLCCCGDIDQQREYCCCDCEELDDACERLLRREPEKPDIFSHFVSRIANRLGLPCCAIGPLRMELSVLPPMVLLPGLLRVAAINCMLGVVTLTALPGLVLWYYYVTHKRKRRTLFFLCLALFSLAYMYYLFLTEILPRGDVSSLQVVTATTGLLLTLISLVRTKQGPGFVKSHSLALNSSSTTNQTKNSTEDSTPCYGINLSKGEIEEKKKWCPVCRLVRPPRAGHCRICGACVLRMDHHCVWINSCVGQANHKQFILTLLLFLLTSFYGISLVLRSICPHQSLFTAMLYCPGVYNQYSTALCFTCVWYSSIITGGLLYLFILQIINVCYNITEREAQIALRNKSGRRRYFGLVVDTGIYSQGLRQNWIQFLTMSTDENISPLIFTDMGL